MAAPPNAPAFFTVEEAARILRIGRTAAYELARSWRETDGQEGLPVVAFGRLLRVPRAALEIMSGGPLKSPSPVDAVPEPEPPKWEPDSRGVSADLPRTRKHARPRSRSVSSDQTSLPFD